MVLMLAIIILFMFNKNVIMVLFINNSLKLMIKKLVCAIAPFVKPAPYFRASYTYTRIPLAINKTQFSTNKQGKEPKSDPKSEAKSEQKVQDSTKKDRKLTDLSNQELIELNTEQSLKLVSVNIKKMEQLHSKQQEELKQLTSRMEGMDKHHSQSINKEELLLQNIKMQEEELQRIKKRADKEIDDSKDFAITKLVKELLQFADSIKRCKTMAEEKLKLTPNDQYLKKMINLSQQLKQFLKLYDIEEFDPINQPFDPNTSQSLVTIPTPPGYQKNNVATTMMTGYKIKSRLLRSAKVGVFI